MNWDKQLEIFDEIAALAKIERKGKTVPYTSENGYMFSLLNKEGEFGIRMPKEKAKKFLEENKGSGPLHSHGATMRDYVKIPATMMKDTKLVAKYLKESQKYVMSLEPK